MSLIMIQPQRVQEEAGDVAAYAALLQSMAQRLNQLLHSIAPEIMARRGLYSRMQAAVRQLHDIEARLRTLQGFLGASAVSYERTENSLLLQAERIGTGGAVVPGCPPEGSPHRHPSSEQLTDLLEQVSGAVSYFNDVLSKSNNAVVATGLAATLSALASTANLHVRYVGGKPTLLQKIKGNYKFTVTAHTSWTSKSKYSSSIARALYNFSKSTPSNRWLGKLQRYAASYNGPAAMIKHLAGFSKNANAAMYGSSLFSASTQRSSTGVLNLAKSAALNQGWKAGAKWIPLAGSVVSFVSHSTEEWQTPGRSMSESAGRVFAATMADAGAMWIGAKVGAAIGSVGGPVGIIVGGAVGALVGGIASSQFGDEIKQIGGTVGKEIEKVVKNVGSAANHTFKSIQAWFS